MHPTSRELCHGDRERRTRAKLKTIGRSRWGVVERVDVGLDAFRKIATAAVGLRDVQHLRSRRTTPYEAPRSPGQEAASSQAWSIANPAHAPGHR